jgi:hypothetical protein
MPLTLETLATQIPTSDGLYGRGVRDALESIWLALRAEGVADPVISRCIQTTADAYGNYADDPSDGHEIQQVLMLSTAHLSLHEREQLSKKNDAGLDADGVGLSMACDYGWLLYVDADAGEVTLPIDGWPGVSAAVARALLMGATHVRFDADGPIVEDLPEYTDA